MKDEWQTPPDVFDWADKVLGPFDMDGAASSENTKVLSAWTDNASVEEWNDLGGKALWLNPPYSNIPWFIQMAKDWVKQKAERVAVCLIRFDPSTNYWKHLIHNKGADTVVMWPNRIKFVGAKGCYNFPCALVIFDTVSELRKYETQYVYPKEL